MQPPAMHPSALMHHTLPLVRVRRVSLACLIDGGASGLHTCHLVHLADLFCVLCACRMQG
jgi:hypothetical protein